MAAEHSSPSALVPLRHRSQLRVLVRQFKEWAPWLVLLAAAFHARRQLGGLYDALATFLAGLRRSPIKKNFLEDSDVTPSSSAPELFSDFRTALPAWLSEGLNRQGFHKLKPIQRDVLPLALAGKDIIGTAPTGSGKTLAFLVPALVHAAGQPSPKTLSEGPVALVLAPTRELALQIGSVAEQLVKSSGWQGGRKGEGLSVATLYGGERRIDQLQRLRQKRRVHLVVATIGRLLDFVREQKAFRLRSCSFFVLDEGDKLLDYNSEEEVAMISAEVRPDRQMLFFSATWPPAVEEAAARLCRKGFAASRVALELSQEQQPENFGQPDDARFSLPPSQIRQMVEVVRSRKGGWDPNHSAKLPLLLKHLEDAKLEIPVSQGGGKALVFVKTRNAAEDLGELVAQEFGLQRCGVMHGLRRQEQRETTLRAFRNGEVRALVATDVLGRGVDIPGVTHVMIYDFPDDIETYVHRVGRTGRNGASGTAISFFEPQHWNPDLARDLMDVLKACEQDVPQDLLAEVQRFSGNWDAWQPSASSSSSEREVPPLDENGGPPLATAEELREWNAGGDRIWSYSANGGRSEQGRLEFRSQGKLRTTWGWGTWQLVPALASASGTETDTEQHMAVTWKGVTDVLALDSEGLGFELVSRNGRPAATFRAKTVGNVIFGLTEL
eukprot:TRINITY_DN55450_c0_g1_i1.p1 TRINITY_DN55450_c0_g1~~TRINITY_DN55450_c0_g1_i1.p1  ORF type:complete len:675 (+),score=146.87 TRINITY_DN55450_c0_g1_i1:25-2025(+)